MANSNGWGDGAANNAIGWGQGANNAIGWGSTHATSWAGLTDISGAPTTDPDAQAFITAAAITDPTQQAAINTLVVDLKGYNVWTKMKALYPFVGGTASTHKFNLKDPRDLDAAFRLVFSGGVTHSSTGATFNGTNGFADTKLASNGVLAQNSTHFSAYSRTNNTSGGYMVANGNAGASGECKIFARWFDNNCYTGVNTFGQSPTANADSRGYFIANRISATQHSVVIRGTKTDFNTNSSGLNTNTFRICSAISTAYDNKEIAFASVGDGLSDTEAANFYTAVQTFQTTLGRSIGTQTVSDADAQAFVTNAGIVDQVEANAINNLVIGMKADGLWTKMKAVYPFVGGTATTHKFNLKNPLDTDAAFRLVFNGGWTHSSTGALPNGTNGWADTFVKTGTDLALNSTHVSIYSRTNNSTGAIAIGNTFGAGVSELSMWLIDSTVSYLRVNTNNLSTVSNLDSRGLFIGNRNSSTVQTLSIRGTQNNFNLNSNQTTNSFTINLSSAIQAFSPTRAFYDNKQYAFASIGDGLTSQNMTDLDTIITTFQTALNRNI